MIEPVQTELRRLFERIVWSWNGWALAWASERSLRQWALVNVVSVLLAFVLDLTAGERALIIALGLLILVVELINTAIEEIVDLVSPQRNPLAGKAKDCSSAAVAVAAIAGGVAWLVILLG